jgi:23S rRNA-/tRNA-specific pseudouridylate synthase
VTRLAISAALTMAALCSAWTIRSPRLSSRARAFSVGPATCSRSTQRRLFETNSGGNGDRHWNGAMTPFSEYAMHVKVGERDVPVTVMDAIRLSMGKKIAEGDCSHLPVEVGKELTPQQLLRLGSIWYLPRDQYEHNQLQLPNSKFKPVRLSKENSTMILEQGDYMRIHHTPRQFTQVYGFDWKEPIDSSSEDDSISKLPSTIIHSSPDFWIIDKPPLIPVHATVDNAMENAVHQLSIANPEADYVVTTQRIDVNTSGLLVVARTPRFAAYFAQLLRWKTKQTHDENNIFKRYKCLVCMPQHGDEESVFLAWQRLSGLQNTTIRHYLEPSDRAPLRFEPEPPIIQATQEVAPQGSATSKKWLECRLKITGISQIYPIPNEQHPLSSRLWASAEMPPSTKAVCEVSIQLETGRSHQIRGQLSRLGFPLVGDELYGGAIPVNVDKSNNPQLLALQSSHVGFWDADYTEVWHQRRRKNVTQGIPSKAAWVESSLDRAWWSSILEQEGADESITSSIDAELVQNLVSSSLNNNSTIEVETPDLLPPAVQLSPGRNKYVLIKVETQVGDVRWFVKSASPKECGGPYHANVAEDLVEWIHTAGFEKVTVTGGGRIDYIPTSNRAHVYGFSYGFGKGDHARAAELITEAGFVGTYDNSNALY